MKIAILTLPLHTNYGGILQAYALQTILERMGHEVEVLDKKRKMVINIPFLVLVKRFILHFILLRSIPQIPQNAIYKRKRRENKYTWKFADHYIHRREIVDFDEIKETDYDAIIVGSDQVWRPKYFSTNYNTPMKAAFLGFAEGWNINRISYAASFGVDSWEFSVEDTNKCKDLVKMFRCVSVRENSAIRLLNDYLNYQNAVLMPDPTLLLKKEDYMALSGSQKFNAGIRFKGKLLVYMIDLTPDKMESVKVLSERLGVIPVMANSRAEDVNKKEGDIYVQPPVEQWLKGFQYSDYVITDSFHACLFSIIFEKPFVVYGNSSRGLERFISLLSRCKLENRMIMNSSECYDIDLSCNLKYAKTIIAQERDSAMSFLSRGLKS